MGTDGEWSELQIPEDVLTGFGDARGGHTSLYLTTPGGHAHEACTVETLLTHNP